MKPLAFVQHGVFRGSIPSLALWLTSSFPPASYSPLPSCIRSSVLNWWLTFIQAGLPSLLMPAFLAHSYSSPVSLGNFDSTFCALSFALFPILKARITNLESRNQFRNPHSKFRIQKAPFPLFPSSPTRRAVALVRCDASRRAQRVNLFPFLPFNLLIHLDLCQQPMIFCKP